jgi:hypothetical protein
MTRNKHGVELYAPAVFETEIVESFRPIVAVLLSLAAVRVWLPRSTNCCTLPIFRGN